MGEQSPNTYFLNTTGCVWNTLQMPYIYMVIYLFYREHNFPVVLKQMFGLDGND